MNRLIVAALAVLGPATVAYRLGIDHATARAERQAADALARASIEHRRAERALQGQIDTLTTRHMQEISRRERSTIDLAARLRAGAVRVSIPVAACAAPGSNSPASPASPAAAAPRAELAPETTIALDRIAADGDAAILDLNACLAAYEAARATVAAAGNTGR